MVLMTYLVTPLAEVLSLPKSLYKKVLKTESLLSVNDRNFPLDQPKMFISKTLFHKKNVGDQWRGYVMFCWQNSKHFAKGVI